MSTDYEIGLYKREVTRRNIERLNLHQALKAKDAEIERLKDRINELENSFGQGAFRDGQLRRELAEARGVKLRYDHQRFCTQFDQPGNRGCCHWASHFERCHWTDEQWIEAAKKD